ncbi:hypothetical protein BD289DRAFT_424964 [Coniella lustricola]|uniref:Uncharacterized protein n=1 Tax=Coniella lustricola TaxID=2025994 RepID=A0A2T3AI50_9PEZI|nr:hypothetical protein BD289DRAFT_424964 [Coniella lustricola]
MLQVWSSARSTAPTSDFLRECSISFIACHDLAPWPPFKCRKWKLCIRKLLSTSMQICSS